MQLCWFTKPWLLCLTAGRIPHAISWLPKTPLSRLGQQCAASIVCHLSELPGAESRLPIHHSVVKMEVVDGGGENVGMEAEGGASLQEQVVLDKTSFTVVQEGQAEVLFPSSHDVFYNPVQEFNRDLSVAVLRQYVVEHFTNRREKLKRGSWRKEQREGSCEEKNGKESESREPVLEVGRKYTQEEGGLVLLEALSASGLRSIRYAKEVPGIDHIVANDLSSTAMASIQRNISHNNVSHLVVPSECEAALLMYKNRRHDSRFHAIDLDPYGCPAVFLDGAVQSVQDGGILMVTSTDTAVLCGNTPETCYTKYGAVSLKTKACHEMALRILLQCIESHANRYGRYVVPILSVSADFYLRVFVRVFTGQAICKRTVSKLAMVYQCTGCESFVLHPLGKCSMQANNIKHSLGTGPPVGIHCEFCGHKHHVGGPIWIGRLHDREFVASLLDSLKEEDFRTFRRMEGVLSVILEELEDVPLYYVIDRLNSIIRTSCPSMLVFRSALMNAGYRVSLSHACKSSLKTDAPNGVIWDIMRRWEQLNPVCREKFADSSPGKVILSKQPVLDVSFEVRSDANPVSRERKLVRYQVNPEKNWGPKMRAKTSLLKEKEETKRKRNQGKRSRSTNEEKDSDRQRKKLDTKDAVGSDTEDGLQLGLLQHTDDPARQTGCEELSTKK